jgi:uncharacterized membrane protein YgdD (TMEM256/DUF423 family)
MSAKKMLLIGALFGALAVTFGAFGAHGMPNFLRTQGLEDTLLTKRLGDWEIASRYLMYHALAVFACGLLASFRPSRSLNVAVWFFILGALIFSGCLYALVLTGITKPLGMIVPIGGLLMIFGWLALAYAGGGYCTAECDLRKPDA